MFPAPDDAHNATLYANGEELLGELMIQKVFVINTLE